VSKLTGNYKQMLLSVVMIVGLAFSEQVFSQHKGHDMQG